MPARRQRDAEVAVVRPAQPRATPTAVATATERRLPGAMEAPIDQVAPDPEQPRKTQNEAAMLEMTESVRTYGILQPLIVRENGALADGRARYTIVAGGRRYEAARRADLAALPVVVLETESARVRLLQLIENLHREDLDPIEQAQAVQEILDAQAISAEELGRRLHKSGQWVRNQLSLFEDPALLDATRERRVSPRVVVEINRMGGELREEAKRRVLQGDKVTLAGLSTLRAQRRALGPGSGPQTAFERTRPGGTTQPGAAAPASPVSTTVAGTRIQTEFESEPSPLAPRATVWDGQQAAPHAAAPAALESTPAARVRADHHRALQPLLGALGDRRTELEAILDHGAVLGWSCAELLSVVREVE